MTDNSFEKDVKIYYIRINSNSLVNYKYYKWLFQFCSSGPNLLSENPGAHTLCRAAFFKKIAL